MLKGQGNLPQGGIKMAYFLDKSAWGYGVSKVGDGKKCYVYQVHRNGTYEFTNDYTLAKRWSKKTALKHMEILEGGK